MTKRRVSCLLAVIAFLGSWAGTVAAQEPGVVRHGYKEYEARQTLMSERTFKRLSSIHDSLGEKNYTDVMSKLGALGKSHLTPYEEALVIQTYGFVYAQQGDYKRGIEYFERSVALDALPTAAQQGMLYSLASLYTSQEQYQKSIDTLVNWYAYEKEPSANSYILMATNYAQMERYREALPYVRTAIAKDTAKPKESWYQLELAIYFELQQYANATNTLRTMLTHWPDKLQYWENLSGSYQELKEDQKALAALMLAYRKGLFTDDKKILNVVRMNMFMEDPYQAGKILQDEMNARRVPITKKNLALLLSAWKSSREFEKAIAVIDRLAPNADDGEYYLEKAQLFAERNKWQETIDAAQQAIDKGKLKRPGTAYVLLGQALAELQKYRAALNAFRQAKKFDKNSRKIAQGWEDYVRDRMNADNTRRASAR